MIVMFVFTEVFMLPFTLVWGWQAALMVPGLIVGVVVFVWAFDHAVRWVLDGE